MMVQTLWIPFKKEYYIKWFKYIVKALSWYHWKVYIQKENIIYVVLFPETHEDIFQKHIFSFRGNHSINEEIGNKTIMYTGEQSIDNEFTIWHFSIYNGLRLSSLSRKEAYKSVMVVTGPDSTISPFIDSCKKKLGANVLYTLT